VGVEIPRGTKDGMIRDAQGDDDLSAIVEIYNASIPGRFATADTEPVSVEARREWFRRHDPAWRPLWVVERQQAIVGWLSFESFYGRPAYAATAEVSVYVAPECHRQGIATVLLTRALNDAPSLGLSTLLGFVFAHNRPSLLLLERRGFKEWARLPDVAELDGIKRSLLILGRHVA
jgi:L-amino acid N-acyltransferase YncA